MMVLLTSPPRDGRQGRFASLGERAEVDTSGLLTHRGDDRVYRERFEHYGHGRADQAIVGLVGQVFVCRNSQDAVREFRPYFDNAMVYGHGPSLEDFTAQTPLTVGSPQEVIEKTLAFQEFFRHYQRPALLDHAGLPIKVVLEQLNMLSEITPELRRGFDAANPPTSGSRPNCGSTTCCSR